MNANNGVSNTLRTIRVPDDLWARVEEWSGERGTTPSDASRALMRLGLDAPVPKREVELRAPLKWMRDAVTSTRQRHECLGVALPEDVARTRHREHALRLRTDCAGAPCPQAWKRRPGEWLLVRTVQRASVDFWACQERVLSLEGAVELAGGSQGYWIALPKARYAELSAAFALTPSAVVAHVLNP